MTPAPKEMVADTYLEELNEQQRQAVAYMDGAELVIAGAGSGKTRVLTYKIAHLLAHGYEPWRLLALTFTNKAAREMRDRLEGLVGHSTASKLWMGTFHSIFARILRANAGRIGYKSSFTIYDASDAKALVRSIIKDMKLDEKVYKPGAVLADISAAKNAVIGPHDYAADPELLAADRRSRRSRTYEIYAAYAARCRVAGAMDFDDLLYYTNVLLRDNPDVLRHYREHFRYVLVDEYQDTNAAQDRIVTMLCAPEGNVCVVGDDAQSIYSFRGARIGNILGMHQTYPRLATFKLERNYRSTRNITEAASSLIAHNKRQIPKHVFSQNAQGAPVEVVPCYSDMEEAAQVATRIAGLHRTTGDAYDQFAVLYRTNAQSRVLEESLRRRSIPYRIYGGLSFYQRKEVRDAIAYFRLAVNPDDDEALRRVINEPARGIGETTMGRLIHAATLAGVSLWHVINHPALDGLQDVKPAAMRKLQAFAALIDSFRELAAKVPADAVARDVIQRTGLMAQYAGSKAPENISKAQNLDELMNAATTFVQDVVSTEGPDGPVGMVDFLAQASLATDQDTDPSNPDQPKVTLMTVHAAKGLEFNNVMIVGVEDGFFPSEMSQGMAEAVEEERRLLYVAITRARNVCWMSYANQRFRNGKMVINPPSPFLRDIDPRYLSTTEGRISDRPQSPGASRLSDAPSAQGSHVAFANPRWGRPASLPRRASGGSPGEYTTHTADQLAPGMTISHDRFGRGAIAQVLNDASGIGPRISVDFEAVGNKTLLLAYAKFKLEEG